VSEVPTEAAQAAMRHVNAQPILWQYISERDVRDILKAAAPFIAAQALIQERRRAIRLVRRTLVPRGCEPTKDAADLIDAIKGDLDV